MAEFVEVLKNKERLCESYIGCESGCPMYKESSVFSCSKWIIKHPQEAEKIIMTWVEKHPLKSNAEKFEEVFGYKLDFFSIEECTNHCIFECGNYDSCEECDRHNFWNKEYKEPKEEE